MSDLAQLELDLKQARARREAAVAEMLGRGSASTAPLDREAAVARWEAADQEELRCERRLAAARGEPYAETIDFPVRWDIGAPMPQVVMAGRVLVSFCLGEVDPDWDGSYARIANPADAEPRAIVQFEGSVSAKFGSPNDEVFGGHPLHGRGLDPYRAQIVRNSPWLAELEAMNRVHSGYRPERWKALNHYVFWFHDETFECVAESFRVERRDDDAAGTLAELCRRALA